VLDAALCVLFKRRFAVDVLICGGLRSTGETIHSTEPVD
jgi:hypothetical protein